MAKKPIDYSKIKESNILILKSDKPIKVEFKDNGYESEQEIIDKQTNNKKTVPKYVYDVLDLNDNNKEKELSFLAKEFPITCQEFIPLKKKQFLIRRIEGIDEFDIKFKMIQIE
jgi:hypothetical protein